VKSNGNPGITEVYGAKIEKPPVQEIKGVKKKSAPETPKPPKKYDHGNTVYVNVKGIPFTNGIVIGSEWGGSHRQILRDVWCYWIQGSHESYGSQSCLIPEDKISGRISL
jgi:hypothetical protein